MESILEGIQNILDEKQKGPEKKKAKSRSRGKAIFPYDSPKVKKDKPPYKDHFPINTEKQARNALSRVNQYKRVPPWYNGTLPQLKKAVAAAVKKAYPSIEVSKKSTD